MKNWMNDPIAVFNFACACRIDGWFPACGGTEVPFVARSGKRLLYCYNPATEQHGYMDVASDMLLTDDEARAHLNIC